MEYSVRSGKLGFECDVCGVFVGDLRFYKSCYKCHKALCALCSTISFIPSNLPPQFFRNRKIDKPSYVCPDCNEEFENEEIEAHVEKEEESSKPENTCQICGANDGWDGSKTFPSSPPLSFHHCGRCGKLICNFCSRSSTDMMHGYFYEAIEKYDMVCKECYEGLEREYACKWDEEFGETSEGPNPYRHEQKREDYWSEKEEKAFEE